MDGPVDGEGVFCCSVSKAEKKVFATPDGEEEMYLQDNGLIIY